jgi:DNA (cytosine-5)-methyltransferase 1
MFLENVKHILKVSNGAVIEYIKKRIDEIGYKLQLFKMSPHDYGIPQQRERIFFVCVRKDIYNNKDIELLNINKNLTFKDILEKNVDSKYRVKPDVENVFNAWEELIKQFDVGEKLSPTILINDAYKNYTQDEFENLANWRKDYMTKNKRLLTKYKTIFDPWYEKHKELLNKREIYGKLEWQAGPLKENDSIFNYFITLRQSGIRVKRAKYFPTLVAISQIPIYAKEKRYLTPRECARLQSYPESLKLHDTDRISYKQMGNSVNVFNTYTVINSTLNHYGYNH